jgi:D-arginine dehydrogenase
VIVVGGGVAGLSAAVCLAARARVLLLEAAPLLASRASGNSAAIFRPIEQDARSAELPRRSRQLLDEWLDGAGIDRSGLLLVSAEPDASRRLAAEATSAEISHTLLDAAGLAECAPSLRGGEARYGLWLRDAGVLDVARLTRGLAALARARGAELRTDVAVREIHQQGDRITAVLLSDGSRLPVDRVVLAAGAYGAKLGAASGAPLQLIPLRRHLAQLTAASGLAPSEPVVWREDDEIYYRREGDALLASPCDETVGDPASLESDPRELARLAGKLARVAPRLAGATIDRAWACLRTFAPDRELVVGEDPRVHGLHWFGGLGGRGMSVAPAAAELLTAGVLGDVLPLLAPALSPARLL